MELFSFTDSGGVVWTVREDGVDDPHGGPALNPPGTTWLRFESEMEVRRLWHFPDDWRGLNPVQLESLLDRASTVVARFRPVRHREADRREEHGDAEGRRPVLRAPPPSRGSVGDRSPRDPRAEDRDD